MHTNPYLPRLIQVLQHHRLLNEKQIKSILNHLQRNHQPLLPYILQHYHLDATTISQACAEYFSLPHRELHDLVLKDLPFSLLNEAVLQNHAILPLHYDQQQLHIAFSDPDDFSLVEDIQYQTRLQVQAIMAPYDQLSAITHRILSTKHYASFSKEETFDQSAVTFVTQILADAIHRNASDIHCEPMANQYRIRMRIDGLLHEIIQLPNNMLNPITGRLKVLAQCDIAEHRLPQDGRFTFTHDGQTRDCRLSSCPTLFGEKIVIRILNPNQKLLAWNELGLEAQEQTLFLKALTQPQGLILVTGPTGSGKTITLYTALHHLNQKTHNISTVEQPVEIQLTGVNQVNIAEKSTLTFAGVLRALLRQDPDVIMVGEIRDKDTAEIAVRAAQTGHLVLSTLHTNSAADTLIRLLNMGIAPFNLAGSLHLIIAQRLVRKLCNQCKQPQSPIDSSLNLTTMFSPNSCSHCLDGYQGRTGVFEIMPISKQLSTLILQQGVHAPYANIAEQEGMQNLWNCALNKVQQGITSLAEIYRVVAHE